MWPRCFFLLSMLQGHCSAVVIRTASLERAGSGARCYMCRIIPQNVTNHSKRSNFLQSLQLFID